MLRLFLLLILFFCLSGLSRCLGVFSDLETQLINLQYRSEPVFDLVIKNQADEQTIIQEQVINGGFENDLAGWDWIGQVQVLSTNQELEAAKGEKYLQLGSSDKNNQLEKNCISQKIKINANEWPQLHFYYLIKSTEDLNAFDSLSLVVLINELIVFFSREKGGETEWKNVWLNLEDWLGQEIELKICAGNSGDNLNPTWAFLDGVSSSDISFNIEPQIKLVSIQEDIDLEYQFEQNGELITSSQRNELLLPTTYPLIKTLKLIAKKDGLIREEREIELIKDEINPARISDLTVLCESNNTYSAYFSSDQNNLNLTNFEFKFSENEFTQVQWNDLARANNHYFSLNQPYFFENYWLPLKIENIEYCPYLAVKQIDVAGNKSLLSNVVKAQEFNNQIEQTIFINEIMFNPEGNDYGDWQEGEWIELFNNSNSALDLAGWIIEDEVNHSVEVSKQNSDSNQNFSDQGETVILPKSYLVVYVNKAPIFNNSGDIVKLRDVDGSLIEQHQYNSSTDQGKTTGRSYNDLEVWLENLDKTPNLINSK